MRRRAATAALALAALTGVLVLLLGAGDEPPEDRVVGSVAADALLYVHLDRDSDGWREAQAALERLPALADSLRDLLPEGLELSGEGQVAVARLPAATAGAQPPVAASGLARTVIFDEGDPELEPPVRSLDRLPDYSSLVASLQEERFAHAYLAPPAAAELRSLDGSIESAAASAAAVDGRMRFDATVRHSGPPGRCSRRTSTGELLDAVGRGAAIYLELPSIACGLRLLARRVRGGLPVLRRFARLLPVLEGPGALVAAPGEESPVLTLVVDDVDEAAALDTLAALQPTLIDVLGTQELGQAPVFGAAEVDGVTAVTARLAPGLELSYAAWDDRLVVSTALAGVEAVRRSEGVAGSERFEGVLGERPDELSALLFLDLDQLLALGEQTGLGADPRYLAIRDDLQKLRAVGAVLTREEELTTAELTFHIP